MKTDGGALEPARKRGAVLRSLARLCVLLVLVYGIHLLIGWASEAAQATHRGAQIGMIVALLFVYAVLIAVPFVPGVEIGLSLMAIEGPWIAPLIYAATVLGLMLAYCLGEWLPDHRLHRVLEDLRLRRASLLLERLHPLGREDRLAFLQARAPRWLRPLTLRLRYGLLAVLVNLPGNFMIGGGGGVFFAAGLSRLFHPAAVMLTIIVAVLPVPLAVWVFGIDLLG